MPVLESEKPGATHLGYFWVYHDPLSGSTLFKYEEGRGKKFPQAMLNNFTGYLQTDGYEGYSELGKSERIVHLGCWAHVRRKFEESIKTDAQLANIGMGLIQKLYDIEREARENKLSPEQRKELRLDKSLEIYNLLGKWIASNVKKTLPRSPIGKAMNYALQRWDELGNFMKDGMLEIDNNLVENAIRPIAIGRKNWLFAGSHQSAQRLAIMYTFMSDCKKHNINPETWLTTVLEKIQSSNIQELSKLLPENFS